MSSSRKNNGTPISAWCGGQLKKVGVLKQEGERFVFEQRIKPENVLKIRGAAGVDLHYSPELPEQTIIRHIVGGVAYEIPLAALRNHEKMTISKVGSVHPARMYLSYRFWRNRTAEKLQPCLFPELD